MGDEKKNQIIDEAYGNFVKTVESNRPEGYTREVLTKNEFITEIKRHNDFSERWGLKIEERELSLEERKKLYEYEFTSGIEVPNNHWLNSKLTTRNIPTKLITLTYNSETIESYE